VLLLLHFTVLLVAFVGLTVAENVVVVPTFTLDTPETDIEDTETSPPLSQLAPVPTKANMVSESNARKTTDMRWKRVLFFMMMISFCNLIPIFLRVATISMLVLHHLYSSTKLLA
jgi:hypothetical protein